MNVIANGFAPSGILAWLRAKVYIVGPAIRKSRRGVRYMSCYSSGVNHTRVSKTRSTWVIITQCVGRAASNQGRIQRGEAPGARSPSPMTTGRSANIRRFSPINCNHRAGRAAKRAGRATLRIGRAALRAKRAALRKGQHLSLKRTLSGLNRALSGSNRDLSSLNLDTPALIGPSHALIGPSRF